MKDGDKTAAAKNNAASADVNSDASASPDSALESGESERRLGERGTVIFCGLMFSISAFSIDIMLPAFSEISARLEAPMTLVQMSVTVYMLAFGFGQLFIGPAADRWGRRPAVIGGVLLFLTGAVIAMLATRIEVLLAGRALQGFGGATGHVAGRAILRDLFFGRELARRMATATAILAVGPIVAPLLGWALIQVAGWRSVFFGTALFGAGLLWAALFRLPETARNLDARATSPKVLMRSARRYFGHPQSLFFTAAAAAGLTAMLSFVASAPRIYAEEFGVSGLAFAALFASHGFGIILGQVANRRIIARGGALNAAVFAGGVLCLVSAVLLGLAAGGILGAASFAFLMFWFATSFLIVFANSASLTLDPHGDIAGFASSMFGFGAQFFASLAASALVVFYGGSALLWSGGNFLLLSAVFFALLLWRFRRA